MSDKAMNGVVAMKQQAIEINSTPEESPEVDLIVSSALDQLDGELTALGQSQGSPTTQDLLVRAVSHASPSVEQDSPLFVPQGISSPSEQEVAEALRPDLIERNGFMVMVPRLQNQWEYRWYEEPVTAVEILEQYDDGEYLVQLDDDSEEVVSRYRSNSITLPLWSFHFTLPIIPSFLMSSDNPLLLWLSSCITMCFAAT